jgi:hypothetical protein
MNRNGERFKPAPTTAEAKDANEAKADYRLLAAGGLAL